MLCFTYWISTYRDKVPSLQPTELLIARHHRAAPEVPCPWPNRSELIWWADGHLRNVNVWQSEHNVSPIYDQNHLPVLTDQKGPFKGSRQTASCLAVVLLLVLQSWQKDWGLYCCHFGSYWVWVRPAACCCLRVTEKRCHSSAPQPRDPDVLLNAICHSLSGVTSWNLTIGCLTL